MPSRSRRSSQEITLNKMVRIIAGRARGCRLNQAPERGGARPTSDRVKEALFNILPEMAGIRFLDLFAGTGNVGLEAMSRGAAWVCFVEKNPVMVRLIRRNVEKCGMEEGFEVLPVSLERASGILAQRGSQFDVIFADPPYEAGWVEKTLRFMSTGALFSREALGVLQHSRREELPENTGMPPPADRRKYGDTLISIFKISGRAFSC